jgi:hypothetical protein
MQDQRHHAHRTSCTVTGSINPQKYGSIVATSGTELAVGKINQAGFAPARDVSHGAAIRRRGGRLTAQAIHQETWPQMALSCGKRASSGPPCPPERRDETAVLAGHHIVGPSCAAVRLPRFEKARGNSAASGCGSLRAARKQHNACSIRCALVLACDRGRYRRSRRQANTMIG